MAALWKTAKASEWDAIWTRYKDIVASVQKEKLVELDEWFQSTLPSALHARDPKPFVTQKELVQLMEWKLKKGKWRPALMKYVENLSADAVKRASENALHELKSGGSLKSAIDALCELKGVGPATASAVLAAYDNNVPFMGDEALEAIAHIIGARKYTLGHYLSFAKQLQEKAKWLNQQATKAKKGADDAGDEDSSAWSSQRVQLCLYAAAHDSASANQEKKAVVGSSPKSRATRARTKAEPEEDAKEDSASRPTRKRRKA